MAFTEERLPIIDPSIYDANLAGLRERQPELARTIESAAGPPARLVEGRDGTATFLCACENGEEWLGGTSMPSVTAQELARGFSGVHENTIVPGIMSGLEVLHLLRRLSRHAAIFVIEPSAYFLYLALRLVDFHEFIERGQVVFLLEDDLEEQLVSFFKQFPGYLVPARVLTIPHRSAAEHAELQRRLERGGSEAARRQAELFSELRAEVNRGHHHAGKTHSHNLSPTSTQRLAILSMDASETTSRDASHLSSALGELGVAHRCCLPDLPDQCHTLARLKCVADLHADGVLLVNSPPGALRAMLPEDLAVISWFFASAKIPAAIDTPVGPRDVFVATSLAQQARLVSAGVPEEKMLYAGVTACFPSTGRPEQRMRAKNSMASAAKDGALTAREADIVLLGDAPDDRPEAAAVMLSTQAALWRECVKIASDCTAQNKPISAAGLLEAAERRRNAKLSDAKIRGELVRKIEERVLPAAFARKLVRALDERFKLACVGSNWAEFTARARRNTSVEAGDASSVRSAGADNAPLPAQQWRTLIESFAAEGQGRWIVLPFFSTVAVQAAVDALAAGLRVALRSGHTPLPQGHPELGQVSRFIHTFTTPKELMEILSCTPVSEADAVRVALQDISLPSILARVMTAKEGVANGNALDRAAVK